MSPSALLNVLPFSLRALGLSPKHVSRIRPFHLIGEGRSSQFAAGQISMCDPTFFPPLTLFFFGGGSIRSREVFLLFPPLSIKEEEEEERALASKCLYWRGGKGGWRPPFSFLIFFSFFSFRAWLGKVCERKRNSGNAISLSGNG